MFMGACPPYVRREHPQHGVDEQQDGVGHFLQLVGLHVSQLITQKSQVKGGFGSLGALQVIQQFVDVVSEVSEQALGNLGTGNNKRQNNVGYRGFG